MRGIPLGKYDYARLRKISLERTGEGRETNLLNNAWHIQHRSLAHGIGKDGPTIMNIMPLEMSPLFGQGSKPREGFVFLRAWIGKVAGLRPTRTHASVKQVVIVFDQCGAPVGSAKRHALSL